MTTPSIKQIWSVSIPIMLSMLAQNIINFTDLMYVGNYASSLPPNIAEGMIGAVGVAGIYYFVLFMVGFGFATGMQILISRRNGEGNHAEIGPLLENGLAFLILLALVLSTLSVICSPFVFTKIFSSPDVIEHIKSFLHVRVWGLPFAFCSVAFRAFHVGITRTRVLTYASVSTAAINILLNYLLIFGHWGFPAMGIEGAALASVLAEACGAFIFVGLNLPLAHRLKYQLFAFQSFSVEALRNIFNVAFYVMIQYTISLSTWFVFFIFIEKAGKDYLDSSQLIRNAYSLVTIPGWAFAAATSSFVSNAIGDKRIDDTMPIIHKMAKISFLTGILMIGILYLFQLQILSIFSPSSHLIEITLPSINIILGAILVFAVSCIYFNGISGIGKTGVAMSIELLSLVFYVMGLLFLYHYGYNAITYWFSEYIYWGFIAIFSLAYLRFGNWRQETKII